MSKYLVAIDAGHGMNTGGKHSVKLSSDLYVNGVLVRRKGQIIKENEWNRAVSEYLAKALTRCNIGYMYTADMTGKTDVALATRSYKANKARADILISNHYNAIGTASQWQTRVKGLLVLRTKNSSSKSITLGKLAVKHLAKDIDYEYSYGLMRDVDMSGYTLAILRQSSMPSILIEYGFMDYEKEAKLMLNPSHQEKCAEAVCKAVCEYFGVSYIAKKNQTSTGSTTTIGSKKTLYLRVIADEVNIRSAADFTDESVIGIVKKGGVYTVMEEIERPDTNMYRLKSGVYITASKKYVEVFEL
ncbi:MAG: N-acetylmuramoyl-L-alanine amidase [Intestinibacter bartlettii]|uniref:N-acetylmuramoyl-L-alanine amidase n=1 Tax=Intestinibacter bartlettii TaxID=261299 RepID=UPI0026EF5096|nr:N-acetylmuramoyl-L-alanine amidase [Intestinibacter bartlettii]MDO5010925.1 N-acetylmuramoyl-L-alanine amidase [Intestinibacter bartlettii]